MTTTPLPDLPKRPRSAAALAYRALTGLAGAILPLGAPLYGPDLSERLALTGPAIASGGLWFHGASVGELNSARVLIEDLAQDFPVIVTANSLTGRKVAMSWGLPAALAPLDVGPALRRFLRRNRPAVQITIENEIWPNRSRLLAGQGVAQVVVGARMSERSARRWSRLSGLIHPVLSNVDLLSAQDSGTEARLLALGLRPQALSAPLQLKLLAPARVIPGEGGPWRGETVLAASTHDGEEALILDAWQAAKQHHPALRLILAPRHPERGDQIAAELASRGLSFSRRGQGADESAPLLLADSLGEMARWYDRAAICVTGGSFTDRGGHTPWEPAAHRCAILHGPDIANFAADYAALDGCGASKGVEASGLADALVALAGDPELCHQMGAEAASLLHQRAGDPSALLQSIRQLAMVRPCSSS